MLDCYYLRGMQQRDEHGAEHVGVRGELRTRGGCAGSELACEREWLCVVQPSPEGGRHADRAE